MGRASILIDPRFLLETFKPGERHYLIQSDIPADAKLVGAFYDAARDVWILGFESDTLPETPPMQELPVLDPPVAIAIHQGSVGAFLEGQQ